MLGKIKKILKKLLPAKVRWACKKMLVQIMTASYHPQINKEVFNQRPKGINLLGEPRMEIGLGQSVRLIADVLERSKYPFTIREIQWATNVRRGDHSWDHRISQDSPYGINLVHINPQELGLTYIKEDKEIWKDRYNIGFWLWELEDFPKEFLNTFKFVNEIWTPSEFTSNCFRKLTDKPVCTIPYYVTAEEAEGCDRTYFGLPEDRFLFLIMFDLNSTMLRKNPIGAINAFKAAFEKNDSSVGLVVKVSNPSKACMDTLHELLDGYENVYYITEILDKPVVNSLIGCVDVFVSLHRAEGFGLVMAEAMLVKTACIATNWSSNTEFMNSDVACMVPYTMVHFEKGEGSYSCGGTWADADVAEATRYMRKLKEEPAFYKDMVERAYVYVSEALGERKIVEMMEKRIAEIYDLMGKCDGLF